jgi:signal transduction histidine kinase
MARRSSRFGARLGLASALLIALVCAGLSWQLARGARADVQRYLVLRADRVVETFAREAREAMQHSDMDALAEAAARVQAQGDVVSARAFDARGLVLAATGSRATTSRPRLDALPSEPVEIGDVGLEVWRAMPSARNGDAPIGAVTVTISLAPMEALSRRILVTSGVVTVLFMVIGATAAFVVARALTRPLATLARATEAVAAGDFTARVDLRRDDELGIVGTAFNVMAESLARSRRALEDKLRELEQANSLKSEFLATVSHELRTPLNVIIGHAEMLDDSELGTTEHAELVATVRRYANLQLDLVTSVLDFERLAAGGVTCRVESFDLGPLVADGVRSSRTCSRCRRVVSVPVSTSRPTSPTIVRRWRRIASRSTRCCGTWSTTRSSSRSPAASSWKPRAAPATAGSRSPSPTRAPAYRPPTSRTSSSPSTSSARAAPAARTASASASASCNAS